MVDGTPTDFGAAGGLAALRGMIEHADPGDVDRVADKWTAIHEALRTAQADLASHTTAALGHWHGSAADAFATRANELHRSLGNGAAYALNANTGMTTAANALRKAKQTMPEAPGAWDSFTRSITSQSAGNQFNLDLATGMTRDQALAAEGSHLSLQEERHQQAIVVMQELESQYHAAAAQIGERPSGDFSANSSVFPPAPESHNAVGAADATTVRSPIESPDGFHSAGREAEAQGHAPRASVRPLADHGFTPAGVPEQHISSGRVTLNTGTPDSSLDGMAGARRGGASNSAAFPDTERTSIVGTVPMSASQGGLTIHPAASPGDISGETLRVRETSVGQNSRLSNQSEDDPRSESEARQAASGALALPSQAMGTELHSSNERVPFSRVGSGSAAWEARGSVNMPGVSRERAPDIVGPEPDHYPEERGDALNRAALNTATRSSDPSLGDPGKEFESGAPPGAFFEGGRGGQYRGRRRSRPGYLIADEEAWTRNCQTNPSAVVE
ncbi:WXG100 family type VII secretion target [Streptacidiphilus sp. EB129]|uniref:WXG100 family type VII secretion target n=1 Tax=Streptacidiphilus sp. EB129 TaxID=3156262 RepID=UPI0035163EBB